MLHYSILFCRSDQPLACPILCLALPNAFTTLTHIPGPSQSKPVLLQSGLSLLVSGSQHILQWFSSPVSSIHLLSYLLGCAGSHLDKPEGKKKITSILHLPSLHKSHVTSGSDTEKAKGKHCSWQWWSISYATGWTSMKPIASWKHCNFELQQRTTEHAPKEIRTIFSWSGLS